ncbi:platelet-derived growth factor receptor alpha isoform X2 [Toxorhynchites rutilus septentrionalis]|uniref:platelet-derived growth factor receptor alpha isoform X2 n=1 Tax=Toxorhynchites rutilus septentrionalis TaxID=329112 RepID=UPI002479135B|nr:platelet-derived growth factor receptor alpha isoform X2 [Toxorhynchites rutilus septentrionalis]
MDALTRAALLAVIIIAGMKQNSLAQDSNELLVDTKRFNSSTEALQLNVSWYPTSKGSSYYGVFVDHVPTENCSIRTLSDNNTDIKCHTIRIDTKATSVLVPDYSPPRTPKYQCVILPVCSYNISVMSLNYPELFDTISVVYQVPECVENVCSCHYEQRLPNISISSVIRENLLIVNWTLGHYIKADLPDGVELNHTVITVRSILNKTIGWEGRKSIKKSIAFDPLQFGSYAFNMDDFPGSKTHFLVEASLYDSRRCYSDADTIRVYIPAIVAQDSNRRQEKPEPEAKSSQFFFLTLIALCIIVSGLTCSVVYYQRKKRQRRQLENWREVYVTSGAEHQLQPMQMKENLLYTSMEILEARARGDADQLEVPHSCLRIGREIGKGAFGRVFMASATKLPGCNGPMIVAVKQLKKSPEADEIDEFLDEIEMLKRVGRHPNIVTLLGCCTIKKPLTMIMEYIGCGDLLEYLRKIRAKHLARVARYEANSTNHSETISLQKSISNNSTSTVFGPMIKYIDLVHTSSSNSDTSSYITQPDTILRPSLTETMYTSLGTSGNEKHDCGNTPSIEYVLDHMELHDFARQIICGMQHLEEKQITHRDLAARNILIDERKTLKISDFGLSRSGIYVNTRNKKVPLRWLSIEAMRDNLYSSKSDVWAFGIVLWEIGTLGGYPYPTVSNHELLAFLYQGKRLERPDNCTAELYQLMLKCWRTDPDERPSFHEIGKMLEPHRNIYIDFNEIEPTYVLPPTSDQIKRVIANNK